MESTLVFTLELRLIMADVVKPSCLVVVSTLVFRLAKLTQIVLMFV